MRYRRYYERRKKINVIDKNLGKGEIVHYTGGSELAAGSRIEGMLCERMDARARPAATGGAGVVGDE